MRYFKTTNASRRYRAGALAFTFDPVENIGGNWIGVLAVDVESVANTLAAAGIPQVSEISAEDYDALKKKVSAIESQLSGAARASVEHARPRCGSCGSAGFYRVRET